MVRAGSRPIRDSISDPFGFRLADLPESPNCNDSGWRYCASALHNLHTVADSPPESRLIHADTELLVSLTTLSSPLQNDWKEVPRLFPIS